MRSVQAGSQLDHYTIDELVARTNTASIFRGMDLRTGRQVSLKIPHLEAEADLVFYQRFRREQEICEKLNHPSIVKAFRDSDHSRVYIVMEFAEGRQLREVLNEQKKLTVEDAVRITLGICEALDYIHSQGVVHRDLKPENVIVSGEDRIKLVDFGIAGLAGARRLTFGKLSHLVGTPDYIAPEQIRRKRGDARTDLYALGVMLYEMLTGETPFTGNHPLAIMRSKLADDPVPLRTINPSITPELQEIVYRALARNPKDRYSNAREFANDLLHQDRIQVSEHLDSRHNRLRQRAMEPKPVLFYAMLTMIPVVIFGLLLVVARSHTR